MPVGRWLIPPDYRRPMIYFMQRASLESIFINWGAGCWPLLKRQIRLLESHPIAASRLTVPGDERLELITSPASGCGHRTRSLPESFVCCEATGRTSTVCGTGGARTGNGD